METLISVLKRIKLGTRISPCTKFNSIWIRDLNIKPLCLKLLEDKARSTLQDKEHPSKQGAPFKTVTVRTSYRTVLAS